MTLVMSSAAFAFIPRASDSSDSQADEQQSDYVACAAEAKKAKSTEAVVSRCDPSQSNLTWQHSA